MIAKLLRSFILCLIKFFQRKKLIFLKDRREKVRVAYDTLHNIQFTDNFLLHDLKRIDTVSCMFKLGASSFYDCKRHVALTDKKRKLRAAFCVWSGFFMRPLFRLARYRRVSPIQLNFPIWVQSSVDRRLCIITNVRFCSPSLSPFRHIPMAPLRLRKQLSNERWKINLKEIRDKCRKLSARERDEKL